MKHRRLSLNFVELVKIESPQNIHEEFHSCGNNSFFSLPGRQKTLKSWDEASLKLTCSFTVHEYHLSPPHTPRMHSPNAVVCCWFKKKKNQRGTKEMEVDENGAVFFSASEWGL